MQEFQRQQVDPAKLPPQAVQKWSAAILEEGFVPFPKKLLRCMHRIFDGSKGSMQELAVLLAIVDFRRPNQTRLPSLEYLAFVAGLKVAEFEAALDRLEGKGFVKVRGDKEALDVSVKRFVAEVESLTE